MSKKDEAIKLALEAWKSAYAAFKGAFDTPLARRRDDGEYATDARKRLRDFDEFILEALAEQQEPVVLRYDSLYEYAQSNRLNYNELCAVVSASIASPPAQQDQGQSRYHPDMREANQELLEKLKDLAGLFPEDMGDDGTGRAGFNKSAIAKVQAARAAIAKTERRI